MSKPDGPQFVLYHGTSPENAEKVMKKGLRPRRPIMGYNDEDDVDWGAPMYNELYPRGVYLTDDIEHARAFGGAVFEVDPSKLRNKNWLFTEDDMAEVYSKRIPPRAMKRIE